MTSLASAGLRTRALRLVEPRLVGHSLMACLLEASSEGYVLDLSAGGQSDTPVQVMKLGFQADVHRFFRAFHRFSMVSQWFFAIFNRCSNGLRAWAPAFAVPSRC